MDCTSSGNLPPALRVKSHIKTARRRVRRGNEGVLDGMTGIEPSDTS